jgi:hypothetical protein
MAPLHDPLLIELLIGLMPGVVWILEVVESYLRPVKTTV